MKKLIFIIFIIISILSCIENFDVELDSTYTRIVIQGSINNELKAHQVIISKSADYFTNGPAPKVTGATVTISDGENIYNLTEVSDGIYETDTIAGEVGKTYTLSVETDDMQYSASSQLNYCAPIDSINFGFYDYGDLYEITDTILYVLMNAKEPASPGDYYLWNIYKNGVLESDTLDEKTIYDDSFVNGNYMNDLAVQYLEAREKDTVTLEMQSITEEYYNYINEVLAETVWDMGPLDGPPANPVSNIEEVIDNGNNNDNPVGFFIAYSVVRITEIVPPQDEWVILEW